MRKFIVIFPILLLGMLVAGTLYAQNGIASLKGDIPFSFLVADKSLPEGTYVIKVVSPGITKIVDSANNSAVVFQTVPVANGKTVAPMFVFRRYGDIYYLAQIWNGSNEGTAVPKTTKELQVAKNYKAPETIYVAAK
ncbi:MAG: hypothetical protein U0V70_04450 [Terriglobia bacterium]